MKNDRDEETQKRLKEKEKARNKRLNELMDHVNLLGDEVEKLSEENATLKRELKAMKAERQAREEIGYHQWQRRESEPRKEQLKRARHEIQYLREKLREKVALIFL